MSFSDSTGVRRRQYCSNRPVPWGQRALGGRYFMSSGLHHSEYVLHDDVIKWRHFPRHWPLRGIHRSPVNSPHKGQMRSFYVFFDLRLDKRLSKQPWGWWFETPSCSLWRHCNGALGPISHRGCELIIEIPCKFSFCCIYAYDPVANFHVPWSIDIR